MPCTPLEYSQYAKNHGYGGFSYLNWVGSLIPMIAQLCNNDARAPSSRTWQQVTQDLPGVKVSSNSTLSLFSGGPRPHCSGGHPPQSFDPQYLHDLHFALHVFVALRDLVGCGPVILSARRARRISALRERPFAASRLRVTIIPLKLGEPAFIMPPKRATVFLVAARGRAVSVQS
jgi:hypothetical protein